MELLLNNKRRVILDTETNRLIKPDKIWCIVCKDIDTNEIFTFSPNTPTSGQVDFLEDFIQFADTCATFIGHNIVAFDRVVINLHCNRVLIKAGDCTDTLVLSRLLRPVPSQHPKKGFYNREYGHGLEAWGKYLGSHKIDFHQFDKFTQEMLDYCIQDVNLTHLVYNELMRENAIHQFSQQSIDLEHQVAQMLHQQVENGFYLDQPKALKLKEDTQKLLEEMDEKLQTLFPPVFRLVRNYTPKPNKDGTLGKVPLRILETYSTSPDLRCEKKEDGSCDLLVKEVFNPQSGDQIAKRLLTLGWQPKYLTDKGNIKTDKVTLQDALKTLLDASNNALEGVYSSPNLEATTLPPSNLEGLRCLADYSIVAHRNETASTWLELALDPEGYDDGRVHGAVNPCGASTHRMSHFNPNMANISRVSLDADKKPILGLKGGYGWECRDCWSVPSNGNKVLAGIDAQGIQLRALAHYMNDPKYTKELLEGDIHEVNRVAAGISTRPIAKTFIYGFLLGAGDEKVGSIMGLKESEWDELFRWAKEKKRWASNLKDATILSLKEKGRKADRKTVATIIKGFKTKEQFLNKTPALKRFKKHDIPEAAKKGYVLGLDGRKIWVPSEHLAMGAYLQGFEAVVIKKAMQLWHEELHKLQIPFKLCATVHDEYCIETNSEFGLVVGEVVVKSIQEAGKHFNTNCPLDGTARIGHSWSEIH